MSANDLEGQPGGAVHATREPSLQLTVLPGDVLAIHFLALGCSCAMLVQGVTVAVGLELGEAAAREAWRIERKFSFYRSDSVVATIHRASGGSMIVDDETAALLDFSRMAYGLSDGLFDITSGALRAVWAVDGSDRVPERSAIETALRRVGFSRLLWQSPHLRLPAGMEIDFERISRGYAVDRAHAMVEAQTQAPFLIDFGGNVRTAKPPPHGRWQVGVERPGGSAGAKLLLDLSAGALATRGDSHRHVLRDGVRYERDLDPRTGWPVTGAPRSVTVAGPTCMEAGLWATLARFQGAQASEYLQTQGRVHWIMP